MNKFIYNNFKKITQDYKDFLFELFDENDNLKFKTDKRINKDYNSITYKIEVNNKFYGFFKISGNKSETHIEIIGDLLLKLLKNKIEKYNLQKEWKIKDDYNEAIIRSLNDGFLVLDKNAKVTHINNKGLEILDVKRNEIIDAKLQKFFKSKLQVLEVLKNGEPINNKELIVKLHNNEKIHLLKNAIPVKNNNNNIIAVIDRFKKIEKVHQFVSNMVGANAKFTFDDIIYSDDRMKEVVSFAKNISKSSPTILIQGESGTGKELFAHAIHNFSYRENNPFVIVDCVSLPRELVESELFGYTEGAFTGAKKGGKPGKFELANGGTIFLDEIGEMPLELQAKLLRVLQSRKISRVGGDYFQEIDVKVIAATNRDLEKEVEKNNFREDLFYRLNVVPINIPPLKKRGDDLPLLINYLLKRVKKDLNVESVQISKKARNILENYSWPGNIRELENTIYSSLMRCNSNMIKIDCLPKRIKESNAMESNNKDKIEFYRTKNINSMKSLDKIKFDYIQQVLEKTNGNKKKAAKILDISRSTLYRILNDKKSVL